MSSITINSNVLGFIPALSNTDEYSQSEYGAHSVDTAALKQELRAELEPEYQQKLEREVAVRVAEERSRFDRAVSQYNASFDALIASLRKEIQSSVVNLSVRLAEVIVRHELPDREMLHNLIVKTLEPVSDLHGAQVRISSNDWNLFGEQIAAGDHLGVGSTVQFLEDPNLAAGDVIVESRNGIFDARLEERLKLLKESLHERSGGSVQNPDEL